MDWLRRLLGIPDGQRGDGNPFRNPTWDEIITNRDSQNLEDSPNLHHPRGHFFHGGSNSSDMFAPPDGFEDARLSIFGQMDDMFSHLESLMRELHHHPAWALPDSAAELQPQTPRDSMLKESDSDSLGTVPDSGPYHGYDGDDRSAQNDHEDISDHAHTFTFSPHSFFDRIFQDFGMYPSETPLSGHHPEIGSAPDLGEHSRESLIKKEDSDIDERVSGTNLPEGRPGYSHDAPQTLDSIWSPWPHRESPGSQPRAQHKFYSQSVVTIRRPDGSIEETKKYTDSTGREEVTVTHKQPDSGSFIQPEGSADQVPSIFSWFFTR